jgi:hypothetical protein
VSSDGYEPKVSSAHCIVMGSKAVPGHFEAILMASRMPESYGKIIGRLPENREFVKLHLGLVLAVDALVSNQTSGGDHIGSHTVPNEQYYVLRLPNSIKVADLPCGNCGIITVVAQSGCINAWR